MAYEFGEDQLEKKNIAPADTQEVIEEIDSDGPIVACIGTRSDFADTLPESFDGMMMLGGEMDRRAQTINPNIDNVSWAASDKNRKEMGLVSGGPSEYVMSRLDSHDKFSSGFFGCLALVVVGRNKNTQENISIMMHTPLYDPYDDVDGSVLGNLINSLQPQLEKIKEECIEGSVDSIIAGGLIRSASKEIDEKFYIRMKDFLSKEVNDVFGKPPVLIGGPKLLREEGGQSSSSDDMYRSTDDMYFENKTRRLLLLRPEYTKE